MSNNMEKEFENDLEKAREQLSRGFTCAFCRDEEIYTAKGNGIKPLLDLLESEHSLKGFSAADIIVGKAAAMLFVLAGARAVYGQVVSESGKAVLEDRGIDCFYDTLVPKIINRTGNGECPMEAAVREVSEPQAALKKVKERLAELKNNGI